MKIGIVCDLTVRFHIAIPNFFETLNNLFDNVKLVKSEWDLDGIDLLFIGNEHFMPHRHVWYNDSFISRCNQLGVEVVIWAGEQIHNTFYPENLRIQTFVEKFEKLHQVVIDVNDAKILNKKIWSTPFSKNFKKLKKICQKKNKLLFIGSLHLPHYQKRVDTIERLKKFYDLDIYENKFQNYQDYIDLLSEYKFILNPHSTTLNGFSGRFYETLMVNSVPVHQVYSDTLDYYTTEKNYDDCIFFEEPEEILEKISNYRHEESYNSPIFEDVMTEFFRKEIGYNF